MFRAGGVAAIIGFLPETLVNGNNFPREWVIYPDWVPGVFVQPKEREIAIREAQALANSAQAAATATISAPIFTYDNTAPEMVGFSSRGPATTMDQLVLKPDVTAPGNSVTAAGCISDGNQVSRWLNQPWAAYIESIESLSYNSKCLLTPAAWWWIAHMGLF